MNTDIFSERFINDLLTSSQSSVHVKDVSTGKYINSNDINVKKFGLAKGSDIVGLTIEDLDISMRNNWGNKLKSDIQNIENKVIKTGKVCFDQRAFLTSEGNVFIHYMTKMPIFNSNGRVVNIYTVSEDSTNKKDLIEIFDLYLHFYTHISIKQGVVKFLEYIHIYDDFYIVPTKAEIRVLLSHNISLTRKYIANFLKLSLSTINTHIENLKIKAKIPIVEIVMKLSRKNRY